MKFFNIEIEDEDENTAIKIILTEMLIIFISAIIFGIILKLNMTLLILSLLETDLTILFIIYFILLIGKKE